VLARIERPPPGLVGAGDEIENLVLRSESHPGTASVRICLTPV
jgi:hypothetical protein